MKIELKKQKDNSIKWEDVIIGNFFVLGTGLKTLAYKYDAENYIMMACSSGKSWGDSMIYGGENMDFDILDQFEIDEWGF